MFLGIRLSALKKSKEKIEIENSLILLHWISCQCCQATSSIFKDKTAGKILFSEKMKLVEKIMLNGKVNTTLEEKVMLTEKTICWHKMVWINIRVGLSTLFLSNAGCFLQIFSLQYIINLAGRLLFRDGRGVVLNVDRLKKTGRAAHWPLVRLVRGYGGYINHHVYMTTTYKKGRPPYILLHLTV